jgi:hypothetical protein
MEMGFVKGRLLGRLSGKGREMDSGAGLLALLKECTGRIVEKCWKEWISLVKNSRND